METLVETLAKLRIEGYTEDFNLLSDGLDYRKKQVRLSPTEFHVDKFFRFEGDTDPADEAILYAISCEKHDLKGVLVNGYGISADPMTNEMLEKLK